MPTRVVKAGQPLCCPKLAATSCTEFHAKPDRAENYRSATAQFVDVDTSQVTVGCTDPPASDRKLHGVIPSQQKLPVVDVRISNMPPGVFLGAIRSFFPKSSGGIAPGTEFSRLVLFNLRSSGVNHTIASNYAPGELTNVRFPATSPHSGPARAQSTAGAYRPSPR